MENAKVYKLTNDTSDKIYIGSSASQYLSIRMNVHRQMCKDISGRRDAKLYLYMREIGVTHFKIELIEKYECKTKEELKTREQYWIDQLKPELNMFNAILQDKEYYKSRRNKDTQKATCKKYYEENKEEISEKGKNYREANKEEINERRKKYRDDNRAKIQDKKKEPITCSCGAILTKGHLSRHLKSSAHRMS